MEVVQNTERLTDTAPNKVQEGCLNSEFFRIFFDKYGYFWYNFLNGDQNSDQQLIQTRMKSLWIGKTRRY
jgi:hypothetical protein